VGDNAAQAVDPDSPDAILNAGHYALRFPPLHEAAFHAATLGQRRRLLMACGILGGPSVVIGSANVHRLMPELGAEVWICILLWMLISGVGLTMVWFTPARRRKHWHGEALTTLMATLIGLLTIWMPTVSRNDAAFTHSAMAALPVMYLCIAARQRFYWALSSSVLLLLCYALFVKGYTPHQEVLAAGNLRLMASCCVLALAANYAFEYRERRNWLLRQAERSRHRTLADASHHLRELSIQDPLTGLANRRHFDATLQQAWSQAVTRQQALAVLLIDVDFFKPYNDTRGHPAGDSCLIQIARLLRAIAHTNDATAARLDW